MLIDWIEDLMPFDEPRNFLEYLEERKELLRITDEVDPTVAGGHARPGYGD